MYKNYMKNALYLIVEAKLRWADIISCFLIANVIKNNITSSVIYNCMLVGDRIVNE